MATQAKKPTATKKATATKKTGAASNNSVKSGDRSAAIIGAAIDMFARYGYQGIGMDDIGAVVGVSGPAIYRHFPNKEALLGAVLDFQGQRIIAEARRIIEESPSPRTALNHVVRTWARHAVTDSARLLVTYFREEPHLPATARRKLAKNQGEYVGEIASLLLEVKKDLSPEKARLRVEASLAMIHSARFFITEIDTESLVDELVEMAMRTLL